MSILLRLIPNQKVKFGLYGRTYVCTKKWFDGKTQNPVSYCFAEYHSEPEITEEFERDADHIHSLLKEKKLIIL